MTKRKRFLSLAQFKALERDRQGNIVNLLDHACRFKDVYLNWLTLGDLWIICSDDKDDGLPSRRRR